MLKLDPFRLPAQTAVNDTTNWRSTDPPGGLKAFTIRIQELQDMLNEAATLNIDMSQAAVRAYLAQKPDPNNPTGPLLNALVFALVDGFVPPNGTDPAIAGTDIVEYVVARGATISGCFDFTYPCPATCATDSPLFDNSKPIVPFVPPAQASTY
jgi:hypothetical protein